MSNQNSDAKAQRLPCGHWDETAIEWFRTAVWLHGGPCPVHHPLPAIYAEHPESGEALTLARCTRTDKHGETFGRWEIYTDDDARMAEVVSDIAHQILFSATHFFPKGSTRDCVRIPVALDEKCTAKAVVKAAECANRRLGEEWAVSFVDVDSAPAILIQRKLA